MRNPGTVLGDRYEILEKIGAGGMADVYKAKDHKLNRFDAVKVLKDEFASNKSFVSKFRAEAQAAAGLMHPNIVNVYDVGDENGLYYFVMELVEGITLKRYIEKKIRLSVKEAVSIPVIGNGDVKDVGSAHNIIEETGCDAVMIGRAAEGNPWIFRALVMADKGLDFEGPTIEERKRMILTHGRMLIECKGEYIGIREMRKHAAWYTQGLPGSARLRGRMNEMAGYEDLKELIEECLQAKSFLDSQ